MYGLQQKEDQLSESVRAVVRRCAGAVHGAYPDAKIILYGSHARGEASPESDMDILVLLPSPASSPERCQLHDRLYEIGLDCDTVISVLIKSIPHWERPISKATSLYQTIQLEGIPVA